MAIFVPNYQIRTNSKLMRVYDSKNILNHAIPLSRGFVFVGSLNVELEKTHPTFKDRVGWSAQTFRQMCVNHDISAVSQCIYTYYTSN